MDDRSYFDDVDSQDGYALEKARDLWCAVLCQAVEDACRKEITLVREWVNDETGERRRYNARTVPPGNGWSLKKHYRPADYIIEARNFLTDNSPEFQNICIIARIDPDVAYEWVRDMEASDWRDSHKIVAAIVLRRNQHSNDNTPRALAA
jgi:hypothetical protein